MTLTAEKGINSHFGIEVFDGTAANRTTITDRLAGARAFHGGPTRYTLDDVYAAISDLHFAMQVEPAQTQDGLVIPGKQALVRVLPDGTRAPITTVGPDYTPLQVGEVVTLMQALSVKWPVHAAGLNPSIGPFFVLDRGDLGIGPGGVDLIGRFLLIVIPITDGRSALMKTTSTRWFCQNQLPTIYAGSRDSGYQVMMPHRPNITTVAKLETAMLGQLATADAEEAAVLNQLAGFRVGEASVQTIINAAFRLPKPPADRPLLASGDAVADAFLASQRAGSREQAQSRYESAMLQTVTRRKVAWERYDETNGQVPKIAGTAWAALQGVTAVATHELGGREKAATAAVSTLLGERALWMRRGMQASLALLRGEEIAETADDLIDGELVSA